MQAIVDPKYYKRTEIISPGLVGSVGDVLGSVRLKQSAPDMNMRYDPTFSGKNESKNGSNVQDGFSYSYTSGGGPARVLDSNMYRPSFKSNHGWVYQDIRRPDTLMEPLVGSTCRYSWLNKIATIYEAKRTGNLFLPLPGPYRPDTMTRGSQYPRVVSADIPDPETLKTGYQTGILNEEAYKPKTTTKTPMESVVKRKIVGYECYDAKGNLRSKTML